MKILRSAAISFFVAVLALFGMPSAAVGQVPSTAPLSVPVPGPAHLVAVANGDLFHTIRNTAGWTPFGDVQVPAGDPGYVYDTASAMVNHELHVVVATDRGLFHAVRRSDNITWDRFGDVFAQTGTPGYVLDVAVADVAGSLHVLVRTSAGGMYHAIRYPTWWTAFGDVTSQIGGPVLVSDIAAAGIGDTLHILAVNDYGRLYHAIRYPNGWSRIGDVTVQTGDPGRITRAAAATVAGELHVLVGTNNGGLFHAIRHDTAWSRIGDVKQMTGDPGWVYDVGAVSPATAGGINTELQIAVVTSDGGLYHAIRYPNAWSGMGNVKQMTGDPGWMSRVSMGG